MKLFKKKDITNYSDLNYFGASNHNNNVIYDSVYKNRQSAFKISAFSKAVSLIAGSISILPIYLYKEENGKIIKVSNDYRVDKLLNEPNLDTTIDKFLFDVTTDLLLYGKSYNTMSKSGLEIKELYNINPETVTEKKSIDNDGFIKDIKFEFTLNNVINSRTYDEMLNFIYEGAGVLYNKDLLRSLLEKVEALQKIVENSIFPSGVLMTNGRLTQGIAEKLRLAWQNLYGGSNNVGRTIVLEEGLKYEPINNNNLSSIDTGLIEKEINSHIEKLFNLPAGILENHSIETNNIFLAVTLMPIINAIESGLNKSLLLESEKAEGYFFRLDTTQVLRATEKDRIDILETKLNKGIISINEARYELDLPSVDEDYKLLSLGNIMQYENGDIYVPNLNQFFDKQNMSVVSPATEEKSQAATGGNE